MTLIYKVHNNADFLPAIKEIAHAFASEIDKDLNWPHWSGAIKALIDNNVAEAVVVYDKRGEALGMLIYSIFPDLITSDQSITEIAWSVKKEARGGNLGLKLLDVMIERASFYKAKHINLTHFALDDKVGRFYQRMGFELTEKHYTKKVIH